MMYASAIWKAERASWRSVVQLNLVRSVNVILDALSKYISTRSPHPSVQGLSSAYLPSPVSPSDHGHGGGLVTPIRRGTVPFNTQEANNEDTLKFTDTHRALRLRLTPLRRVEADLREHLGIPAEESTSSSEALSPLTPISANESISSSSTSAKSKEGSVRSWKGALSFSSGLRKVSRGGRIGGQTVEEDSSETTDVLVMCREDIKTLWNDPVVQKMLAKEEINLEVAPGL
jgi:guanine nucleotide-binding protein alpha-1 subunit